MIIQCRRNGGTDSSPIPLGASCIPETQVLRSNRTLNSFAYASSQVGEQNHPKLDQAIAPDLNKSSIGGACLSISLS